MSHRLRLSACSFCQQLRGGTGENWADHYHLQRFSMALAQHMVMRLRDNRVIAPTPAERRIVARVVLEQSHDERLLSFGLADTHLHTLSACSPEAGFQLARRIELALGRRLQLAVGFARPFLKDVDDGSYLYRAFTYVLKQNTHHGLNWDPLHEASSLPDLLGLRALGAATIMNVRQLLPRIQRADLLDCARLSGLAPAEGPLEYLTWAASAALALPSLDGRTPEAVAGKRAVVRVAGSRFSVPELATILEVSPSTIRRLLRAPEDRCLVQSVRLQLGLMQQRAEELRAWKLPFLAAWGEATEEAAVAAGR